MKTRKRISGKLIAVLVMALGVTALIIVFAATRAYKANQFAEKYDRLLNQYEKELHSLSEYQDPGHYVKRVEVDTHFYIGAKKGDWAYQDCDVKVVPVLEGSFDDLSTLRQCQIVYDITHDLRTEYERIRNGSEFVGLFSEGGRNPFTTYLNVRGMHIGFGDWASILCKTGRTYQYYDGDFYVEGVKYDVDRDWDTNKIIKVTSPYEKRDQEEAERKKKEQEQAEYAREHSSSSSHSSESDSRDIDDQDIESYYYDYRDDFENEDDAWDDLEDNEDEWDD